MTEYGQKVEKALEVVQQLHSDVSKLFVEYHKRMSSWEAVFGSYSTRDMTKHFDARFWMAEGVYRYYRSKVNPSLVEGLTVGFIDPRIQEPIFVIARLLYDVDGEASVKTVCDEWDIWKLSIDKLEGETKLGDVLEYEGVLNARVKKAAVLVQPLYTLTKFSDVEKARDNVSRYLSE